MPSRARRSQHISSGNARSASDVSTSHEDTSESSAGIGIPSAPAHVLEAQPSSSTSKSASAALAAPQIRRSGSRRVRSDSADIDNNEDSQPQRQSQRRRTRLEADAPAEDTVPLAGNSAAAIDAPALPAAHEGDPPLVDEPAPAPEEARDLFYQQVWAVTRAVPPGRVTTYGHIAKVLGRPRNSRLVGQALKFLPRNMGLPPEEIAAAGGDPATHVPWHRVINARGVISARGSLQAVQRQADRLRDEGVEVNEDGEVDPGELNAANPHDVFAIGAMEGGRISLRRFGWFPETVDL